MWIKFYKIFLHKLTTTLALLSLCIFQCNTEFDFKTERINVSNATHSPFYPVYDSCEAYLKEFGYYSSKFIKCTIEKARPFRFCEECVVYYQKTIRLYEDIQQNDEKKDGCNNLLLNADRIQVLSEVYHNVKSIWTEADCAGCFSSIKEDINGTVSATLSVNTEKFLEKYNNVSACIKSHRSHKVFNVSVCDECRPSYTDLNKFFKKLRSSSNHHVCMDLVDMMNYTRLLWGKTLHCSQHYPDDAPVIIIAVLFCLMPTAFYVATRFLSHRKRPKIMEQRRMSRQASRTLLEDQNEDNQARSGLMSRPFGGRGSTL